MTMSRYKTSYHILFGNRVSIMLLYGTPPASLRHLKIIVMTVHSHKWRHAWKGCENGPLLHNSPLITQRLKQFHFGGRQSGQSVGTVAGVSLHTSTVVVEGALTKVKLVVVIGYESHSHQAVHL